MAGIFDSIKSFFTGSPEKHKRMPTLLKQQLPLAQQLFNAGMGPGAGGAFGSASDFYRSILDPNSDLSQYFDPEMRRFNEDIIPGLAEQFAGMGAGGLSSSGFRNASVNAGTDLAERLGAIRANLRSQAASGLSGIGQAGLSNFSQDVMTQPGSQGFLSQVAPLAGQLGGMALGGPLGGAIGSQLGGALGNSMSRQGQTSPYGSANGFKSSAF